MTYICICFMFYLVILIIFLVLLLLWIVLLIFSDPPHAFTHWGGKIFKRDNFKGIWKNLLIQNKIQVTILDTRTRYNKIKGFFYHKNYVSLYLPYFLEQINPFVPNGPLLYPLKTSENRQVFWYFQGVEKGCIGNEWVKFISSAH